MTAAGLACGTGPSHMVPMAGPLTPSPDAAAIERLARAAVDRLPALFRDHLADVIFRVEEFADGETLKALEIESPWQLSGLYQGHPISEQSIWSAGELPPRITLFRCPLLKECADTGVTLDDLVTHVIVHEVGHHFGLSDADMEAIEDSQD